MEQLIIINKLKEPLIIKISIRRTLVAVYLREALDF